MMEMMLTLFIVTIMLMITAHAIPVNKERMIDNEVENISLVFQAAQTDTLSKNESHIVDFDRRQHKILIKNIRGRVIDEYQLTTCRIDQGSLGRFMYKANGDTDAFGTINFNCMDQRVSFVFQIQKGRFRIER